MKKFLIFAVLVVGTTSITACREPIGVDTPSVGVQPKLTPAGEDGTPRVQVIE